MKDSEIGFKDQVEDIVYKYLQPNLTLLGAERLQRSLEEEEVSFQQWEQVADYYRRKQWNRQEVKEFTKLAKDFVESGSTSISETYFRLVGGIANRDRILEELDRFPYEEDAKGEAREGFQYEKTDNGSIVGRYIEVDIDTDLSWSGELVELMTERAIEFEINSNHDILIVKSASVIDVQKAKSIFSKKIDLQITPLAQFTQGRFENDVDSFFEDIDSGNQREVIRVDSITLQEESSDSEISRIELEGNDVYRSPTVRDRLDEGWTIQNVTGLVRYNGEVFKVKIGLSTMMSYAKVMDIQNYQQGRELMGDVRDIFITHFDET